MIRGRTESKMFGGQVWNTGNVSSSEAHAPPVKQLEMRKSPIIQQD